MISSVWRKVLLIVSVFVGLLFFVRHNNFLNNEIEILKSKLDLSIKKGESLSAQIRIIFDHKELIEKSFEKEKLRFEKESKKLTDGFDEIDKQNNKLQALLKECDSELTLFKESHLKETKLSFPINLLNRTIENSQNKLTVLTTQISTIVTEIKLDANKTNSSKEVVKKQLEQIAMPLIDEKPHNYVNENSVHFHRKESANNNLEFQRENNANFDKINEKYALKTFENKANVIPRPKINILNGAFEKNKFTLKNENNFLANGNNLLNEGAPKHLLKKSRQRLEGGENHEDEENVVDFRKDNIPDAKNIEDYKEMVFGKPFLSMANVVNNNTATRRGNQTDRVDFICKVRYGNTLPDLPFEPKFLEAPFVSLNRFIEYKPTSLEKSYKYELLTEPDLNVKIDLIDPMTYFFDPNQRTSMHIKDEKLLEDESVSQQNSKRSLQHSKIVPWMRKTEYISTEFNRYGVGAERQESKVGYGIKKKFGVEHISYKNRESQITAINRTFEEMKKPIKKHYSKPGVYAVDEIPILPDFDMWVIPFAQVIFDADPLPLYKGDRKNKLSHAILRGMMDSDNNQFVGYFPPSDSALEQQLLDDQHVTKDTVEVDKNGTYKEDFEYEHLLEREYNWTVKNKATVGYEQENYFFVFRGKSLFYNELESRVRLTRRLKSSNAKNSSLVIKYRPPSAKELKTMENRLKKLLYPFETLEEEEEGEDEEEEEESVSSEKEDNDNNSEKSEKNVQTKSQTADSSAEEESSSSEHDNEQEKNAVVSSDDDDDEDESADDNENQQLSNVQSQEKSDDDDDSSVEEEKTKKDESSTSSSSSSEDDDDDDD